ncbi:MAG: hypothetical protein NVS3B17_12520 [Vulcanimicrobiaceae bacterium]
MTLTFAHSKPLTTFVATFAMLAMLVGVAPRPARADSASTTATLLGAAAAVAAIVISNNVRHKQQQANAPVGRTQDGGTILGDGRVVYPNGDVLYTGNGNGQECTFTGYGVPCTNNPTVYYPRDYNGGRHDNGHHYGEYKHHHHDDNDEQGDGDHHHHDYNYNYGHGEHDD